MNATSTGNKEVVVQFNTAMGESALEAANYAIVQEAVNPEVGVLRVMSAAWNSRSRQSVRLTTLSQNEVTYRLSITDITDARGRAPGRPDILHQEPTSRTFTGTPPAGEDITDSDGDGLPDHVEQLGRLVAVQCGREPEIREVTSDPFVRDTDGDGLDDLEEYRLASDPRRSDTDGDRLGDEPEFNAIYTDLNLCDSDGDGLDDYSELVFFQTNALVEDSDGDGFTDPQEVLELNRNARLADLPLPLIEVGEVRLQIDERYTVTDVDGLQRTLDSSSSTTLQQSEERSQARSDTDTAATLTRIKGGVSVGGEGGHTQGHAHGVIKFGVTAEAEHQMQSQWSQQTSSSSQQSAIETYQRSLTKGELLSRTLSVTREVRAASLQAAVSLGNAGDVAFSLGNLELSVLISHPEDRTRFVPVATLVPSAELLAGGRGPQTFNLGALVTSKGPVLFDNREIFPALAEDLLRDPRGLVVRVANYDLVDEFGRNFAFSSQIALDRTANLVIDYGDGTVERYLVALHPFYDGAPEEGGELIGGFDDDGKLSGLPVSVLLERVLGLPRNSETPDAIVAGENGRSDTVAQGDDVQLVTGGIEGLLDDTVIITAGENGELDSEPRGDDQVRVTAGYETLPSCGSDTPAVIIDGGNRIAETLADGDDVQATPVRQRRLPANAIVVEAGPNGFADTAPGGDDLYVGPGTPCALSPVGCLSGTCSERSVLTRFKHRREGSFGRYWAVLLSDDRQLGLDFDRIMLRPGQTLKLAFVQDLDRDGVIAQQEYLYGSSDRRQDTDGDGLDDFAEIYVGWEVGGADGQPLRRVFPDPRLSDTDRDGLDDRAEQDIRRTRCVCEHAAEQTPCTTEASCGGERCVDLRPLGRACARGSDTSDCPPCPDEPMRTNPRLRDSDGDGIEDLDEVQGFLSGSGIVQPLEAIIAGPDGDADSIACPEDVCAGGPLAGAACRSAFDCPESTCLLTGCDDVQVLTPGAQGLHPRAVVVGPGLDGVLQTPQADGDQRVAASSGTSDTLAVGDDRQLVSPGIAANPGQALVKPGINGVLDSVPSGGDVALAGQHFLACDPLNPDTDSDLIQDGVERILGSDPTDPRDFGSYADSDADGMSDAEEATLGWLVAVDQGTPQARSYRAFSNPRVADSDNDGLPDLAERTLGTDPTQVDTDADGLRDYDEVSAELLRELASYAQFFRGYELELDSARKYGTDPLRADTDGDELSDDFELLTPFQITVPSEGVVRTGHTDPRRADTDGDGLSDIDELNLGTDPTDPDTDDDTRLDGVEVSPLSNQALTDPLVPDISVRLRLSALELVGDTHPSSWEMGFFAQKSTELYPGTPFFQTRPDRECPQGALAREAICGSETRAACVYAERRNLAAGDFANAGLIVFSLQRGQGIVLNGFASTIRGCNDNMPGLPQTSCSIRFIEDALTFESLHTQGFMTRVIEATANECRVRALIEIEVDGSGP